MRFINDDHNPPPGLRNAVKIDQLSLAAAMIGKAMQIDDTIDDDGLWEFWYTDGELSEQVLRTLMVNDYNTMKDNQFNVSFYNCSETVHDFGCDIGENLGGFHTLKNGLTFFGFFAGEIYATFIIAYHDGNDVRLYTPVKGNLVNMDYQTALGDEFNGDMEDDVRNDLINKHGIFGNEPPLADIYVQKYGFERMELEKVGFNFDAIQEDIMAAIKVA